VLADPQSVTINSVAKSLALTNDSPTQRIYTFADGTLSLVTKQNSTSTRFRREVRVAQTKIAADPISAVNAQVGASVYLVIDEPRNGVFSDTELAYLIDGLKGWLTNANYNKILGGEF